MIQYIKTTRSGRIVTWILYYKDLWVTIKEDDDLGLSQRGMLLRHQEHSTSEGLRSCMDIPGLTEVMIYTVPFQIKKGAQEFSQAQLPQMFPLV